MQYAIADGCTIDGAEKRLKSIPESVQYDEKITLDEFNAISKQMQDARSNAKGIISESLKFLDGHPYKAINPTLFQKIVDKKQWKYKSFNALSNKYEWYSWEELYQLIDSKGSFSTLHLIFPNMFMECP